MAIWKSEAPHNTRRGNKKAAYWTGEPCVLKAADFVEAKGRIKTLKEAKMLSIAETALPINSEVITIVNDDFLLKKLTVVKKNTPRSMTGTVWRSASWRESEKKVERIRTTAKRSTGILRGLASTVIFFSRTTLIPHNNKSKRLPTTTRICFGKVKKSVVIVRKKTGKRRQTTAVTITAAESKNERADLFCIRYKFT